MLQKLDKQMNEAIITSTVSCSQSQVYCTHNTGARSGRHAMSFNRTVLNRQQQSISMSNTIILLCVHDFAHSTKNQSIINQLQITTNLLVALSLAL